MVTAVLLDGTGAGVAFPAAIVAVRPEVARKRVAISRRLLEAIGLPIRVYEPAFAAKAVAASPLAGEVLVARGRPSYVLRVPVTSDDPTFPVLLQAVSRKVRIEAMGATARLQAALGPARTVAAIDRERPIP